MKEKNFKLPKKNISVHKVKLIGILIAVSLIAGGAIYFLNNDQAPPASVETLGVQQIGYKDLASRELSTMLNAKDFFLVNVHIPYEGEIAKTDAFIPYDQIDKNLDKFPVDKNSKIVLYCQSGRMSKIAAEELASIGYTNLYNLSDGMADWEKQGFKLVRR